MEFLACPAYLNDDGSVRCGLPAEVRSRFMMRSTDGPLECAMIRCPVGHWFNAPIESLTVNSTRRGQPESHSVLRQPSKGQPCTLTNLRRPRK